MKTEQSLMMCTPIGHSLAGAIVAHHSPVPFSWSNWKTVSGLLIIANLPDIDLLFGWVRGNPNQYHQQATHSLLFIVVVSLVLGFGASVVHRGRGFSVGLLIFGILAAHLFCDMLGKDTRPPIGIPLFWPVSDAACHFPVSIFSYVQKSSDSHTFLGSLLCWHNVRVVLEETGVMGIAFGILYWVRKR